MFGKPSWITEKTERIKTKDNPLNVKKGEDKNLINS